LARYISDQNKVVGFHESGLYGSLGGNGSVFWIGQVQEHTVTEAENLIETRYLGTATRNFDTMIQGPRDVTGVLTYNPQDMRLLFYSMGSVVSVSGTDAMNSQVSEIDTNVRQSAFTSGTLNPPMSFALEDSKQSPGTGRNFVRTVYGIVPNVTTLSLSQGEKVTMSVDYIAQSSITGSGTTSSVTENTRRPYLWSDSTLTIAGSPIDVAKSISFEVNNNREAPHYLNGSRVISVPINGNRMYTVSLTMDWEGTQADMLYNEFYKNGSKFNMTLDMNADDTTGSHHTVLYMSGCYITSSEVPSPLEGVNEATLEIRPETVTGSEYNFFVSGTLNPW